MRLGRTIVAGTGVAALVIAGGSCLEPGANTLTGVTMARTATNTDTVTFTFFDTLPGTATANYTGTTVPHGTGGDDYPYQIDGKTFVFVVFHSAQSHDQRGRGTAQGAVYQKNMASIAETEIREDFEGYVSYVIGLNTTKAPRLSVVRSGNTIRVAVTKT